MCYSAKIQANYREYVRRYGAEMDIETFRRLFFARAAGSDIKIPKAVDAALAGLDDEISGAIAAYRTHRASELESDLFKQRARLAAAEKKLATKVTKAASEDVRIATDKIEAAIDSLGGTLADVVRTRIFVNDLKDWEVVARAHGERFAGINPANTLVEAKLVGEGYLVEIEAEAIISN